MNCGAADLDDLEAGRGFENAVTDLRRLQDAVTGVHHERRALIFIDHPHPSGFAEDHLEAHTVVVHIIRYLAARWDLDMRGDKAPTQPARDEVAVIHSGAAGVPLTGTANAA